MLQNSTRRLGRQSSSPLLGSMIRGSIHRSFTSGPLADFILSGMLEQDFSYNIANGTKDGTLILHLTGPFTLGNMFQLQSELRTLKPACLIMNLTKVPYMDSAALGVIMNYYVSAQSNGRKFYVCDVNERVRALLELTKVDSVLHLCESVAVAETEL